MNILNNKNKKESTLMDIQNSALELASWTRQRTNEELRAFIESHHAQLPLNIDLEVE